MCSVNAAHTADNQYLCNHACNMKYLFHRSSRHTMECNLFFFFFFFFLHPLFIFSAILRLEHAYHMQLLVGRKEGKGNILFNDALNTFFIRLLWRRIYGKGPFV